MLSLLMGLEGKPIAGFPPQVLDWLTRLLSRSSHFQALRPQEVAVYLGLAQFRVLSPQHRHLLDLTALLLLDGWADLSLATREQLRSSDHRPPYPMQVDADQPLLFHHLTTVLSFDFLCFWPEQKTAWLDSRVMIHTFHFTPVLVWTTITRETIQALKIKSERMSYQSIFLGVFPDFPEELFPQIIAFLSNRIKLDRDDILFKLGDPSEEAFILLAGEISIKKNGFKRLVCQEQMFGEEDMALNRSRTETARASAGVSTVLQISRECAQNISRSFPGFYRRLISEATRKAKVRESAERSRVRAEHSSTDNLVAQELADQKRGVFILRQRAKSAPSRQKRPDSTAGKKKVPDGRSSDDHLGSKTNSEVLEFVKKIEAQYSLSPRFISDNKYEYSEKRIFTVARPLTPGTHVQMRATSADLFVKNKLRHCSAKRKPANQSPPQTRKNETEQERKPPQPSNNMFFFKHRQSKKIRSDYRDLTQTKPTQQAGPNQFAGHPQTRKPAPTVSGTRLFLNHSPTLPK